MMLKQSNRQPAQALHSPTTLSPLRYPGGKSWFRPYVIRWLRALKRRPSHFIEPFAGGASVALAIAELDLADKILLVELDPEICNLWRVILSKDAPKLQSKIRCFKLTAKSVRKELDSKTRDRISRAFRCLLRNRVQRGGIISRTGGLLKKGERGRGLGSRWYPQTLINRISAISSLRGKISLGYGDGIAAVKKYSRNKRAAFFIDPPYTVNGEGPGKRLYDFYHIDHEALLSAVGSIKGAAIVTFHNSTTIRKVASKCGLDVATRIMRSCHHISRTELVLTKSNTD
jgi:DNA adenine methylase